MSIASPMVARRVGADGPGVRHLVMLHGIYGRGRNWLAVARTLVEQRPDWCCWLADMRHHGDAPRSAEAGTIEQMAEDIETWGAAEGVAPDAVLGHSFGGKVALAHARFAHARALQTWVIDSTPDVTTPSGSAWEMLRVVRGLPDSFASRQDAVAGIESGGFDTFVAQWMSTNLAQRDGRYHWALDFDVMATLLDAFFATSYWDVLDPGSVLHDIHVLKATRSSVISSDAVARLERLERHPVAGHARVHLHEREGGHWIHAESPQVVVALLAEFLPRS